MKKQFDISTIQKIWDKVTKKNKTEQGPFEPFCEELDKAYQDDYHNVYVRLLWWCDKPEEIYEELLDLGKRFMIKDFVVFRDDKEECTVIVAKHYRYEPIFDGGR